jgi:hypothetical protein
MDGTRLRHELGHTPTAKFIEHFKAYLESWLK